MAGVTGPQGPRIYNLFPLLAGNTADWREELPRIADMHFNWIYLNPFHYPGFSGSLYAVKDYYRLNPLFDDGRGLPADQQLADFTREADKLGLSVMMDLVINHTARDSLLAEQHPDWFLREENGELISPRAIDPDDANKITVWGDLAELDYSERPQRKAMIDYWCQLLRHYVKLGFRGFRCDAAYKIPASVWRELGDATREIRADSVFMAETLGCRLEEVYALSTAGFDYLFNSAKWWDFKADWLLEQYDAFRHIAPTIAFPESHDTERLATELLARGVAESELEAHYRFFYGFTASFSAGVMMPMGYEFGFRHPLHVVDTRPEPREQPRFDISEFIADTNRMKASTPALNEDGRQQLHTSHGSPALTLTRHASRNDDWVLLLINPDNRRERRVAAADLNLQLVDGPVATEITPSGEGATLQASSRFLLRPLDIRAFQGSAELQPKPPLPSASHTVTTSYLETVRTGPIAIENVQPQIDAGKYPIKRVVGDLLTVRATVFRDGHDKLSVRLRYRRKNDEHWREVPMSCINPGLDLWQGSIRLEDNTRYLYTIDAWTDSYESWCTEVGKKIGAGQDIGVELLEGRALVAAALERAKGRDARRLQHNLDDFDRGGSQRELAELLCSPLLRKVMARWPDRSHASHFERELEVTVDRVQARFASWYEIFPRSQGREPGKSATFADCERRLPDIQAMGFDVLYMVPIHPIGRVNRKGPNNSLNPGPDDPGSPYAIGSQEGGHTAIHPDLGTLEDFRHFVAACHEHGMEVAMDFAIQCAPDHPWVREYPEWFTVRPDGSIKYAENPPKKYQDIVNVNFYGAHQDELWRELLNVILFWVQQGVKIFRVDNPHTKPVPFWEWLIREVQTQHPEVIFLSEAFTRPPMVKLLAKAGFTQSYTYFTWRNFKQELTDYLQELTGSEVSEYLRPNFFPNTPDILPQYLQSGGPPAFRIRLVLAATLSSVYGIYNGFELCENRAVPGTEEYADSEKYQYKIWDWHRPGNIRDYIARVNGIRNENPALHELDNLRFYHASNDKVLFYGKAAPQGDNIIFVAVSLDPFDRQDSSLVFPLEALGIPEEADYQIEELLSGQRHLWRGTHQHISLNPEQPAAIFRLTPWQAIDYHSPCY